VKTGLISLKRHQTFHSLLYKELELGIEGEIDKRIHGGGKDRGKDEGIGGGIGEIDRGRGTWTETSK
jgi:hypothetical protein